MMRRLLCTLFIIPTMSFSESITLTADQCVGGERRTEADGSRVVFLTAAADIKAKAEWTFASPLPPGMYEVEVTITSPTPLNNRLSLLIPGPQEIALELTSFPRPVGLAKIRFVIATLAPVPSISARKYAPSDQDSVGFLKLVFTPVHPAALDSDVAFLWLPVVNGAVNPPFTLPGGMYYCTAHQGSTIAWTQGDGKAFTPPPGPICLNGPGGSLTVTPQSGKTVGSVLLVHVNQPTPDYTLEGNPTQFTAVDPTKTETGELVLNNYQGTGLPEIAVFPHGKRFAITSSWDDGREFDLLVAEKLKAHGFKGTFLMNRKSDMISRLQELEALGGEVGSHTWSHPHLARMTLQQCENELTGMRRFLESQVGHPVISFAYPHGYSAAYDVQGEYVARSVANAYLSARTTTVGETWIQSISPFITFNPNFWWLKTSPEAAAQKFKELATKDGLVFYFWGHSYELDKPGNVAAFDSFLAALENQPETWYATQGEVAIWSLLRKQTVISPASGAKNGKAFILRHPWVHPYLQTTPLSVKVPEGVTSVTWNGTTLPVQNGWVDLCL